MSILRSNAWHYLQILRLPLPRHPFPLLAIRWVSPLVRARENRLLAPRTVSVGDFIYIPCSLTSTAVAHLWLSLGFLCGLFFPQYAWEGWNNLYLLTGAGSRDQRFYYRVLVRTVPFSADILYKRDNLPRVLLPYRTLPSCRLESLAILLIPYIWQSRLSRAGRNWPCHSDGPSLPFRPMK